MGEAWRIGSWTRHLALVMLAATALVATARAPLAQPAPAARPAKKIAAVLRLDWVPGPHHIGPVLAVQRGYYADEGIELGVKPGKGSGFTVQIVAAGQDLFGFAAADATAIAAAKDAPIVMVANTTPQGASGIMTLGAKITAPAELGGKTIGMVPGADTPAFNAVMRKYGIPETAYRVVAVEAAAKVPALLSGQVDLITGFRFGDYLRVFTQNPGAKFTLYSDWGVNLLGNGYIVSATTLAERPDLVRGFVRATLRGWKETIADPRAGIDALMAAFPETNRRFIELGLPWVIEHMESKATRGKPLGWMAETDWKTTLDVLKAAGLLEKDLPPQKVYRNLVEP
jgi:NitT/TauT family transport system substrate-binding protein